MKIVNVTPMVLGTAWRNLTFVKVETDEGLTGIGEARVLNRTQAVLGYLADVVLPTSWEAIPLRSSGWCSVCFARISAAPASW